MWSFGIVLVEVYTYGGVPYAGMTNADISTKLRDGWRLQRPDGVPAPFYQMMLDCWDPSPIQRPDFKSLESMLRTFWDLPEGGMEAVGLLVDLGFTEDVCRSVIAQHENSAKEAAKYLHQVLEKEHARHQLEGKRMAPNQVGIHENPRGRLATYVYTEATVATADSQPAPSGNSINYDECRPEWSKSTMSPPLNSGGAAKPATLGSEKPVPVPRPRAATTGTRPARPANRPPPRPRQKRPESTALAAPSAPSVRPPRPSRPQRKPPSLSTATPEKPSNGSTSTADPAPTDLPTTAESNYDDLPEFVPPVEESPEVESEEEPDSSDEEAEAAAAAVRGPNDPHPPPWTRNDWMWQVSRDIATETLTRGRVGDFLIRESAGNSFSLSFQSPKVIQHFKIVPVESGYKMGAREFESLEALVEHYTTNFLLHDTPLMRPCPRMLNDTYILPTDILGGQ